MPEPRSVVVERLRGAGCVFAEDEADLLLAEAAAGADLEAMLGRRLSGVPLEHVLGWVAFLGLRVLLDPGVFVPRRRTELLASSAARLARAVDARPAGGPVVVDLCCGSGAVAAAVLAAAPEASVTAVDIDAQAVRCARRNLPGEAVRQGDLFDALPADLAGRIDVLIANAPYVPTGAVASMPSEAREHEPRVALDGGHDGLDVLRRVAAGAPSWLRPGGSVLVEISDEQAVRTLDILRRSGLVSRIERRRRIGATVAIGRLPVRASG